VSLCSKEEIGHIEFNYAGMNWSKYFKGQVVKIASAFTVAELGEMLPKNIDDYDRDLSIMFDGNLVKIHYCDYTTHKSFPIVMDYFEANARAAMHIWLIENKKVKP
jgi:hypothetical protein